MYKTKLITKSPGQNSDHPFLRLFFHCRRIGFGRGELLCYSSLEKKYACLHFVFVYDRSMIININFIHYLFNQQSYSNVVLVNVHDSIPWCTHCMYFTVPQLSLSDNTTTILYRINIINFVQCPDIYSVMSLNNKR
jgi:hypothetical protein